MEIETKVTIKKLNKGRDEDAHHAARPQQRTPVPGVVNECFVRSGLANRSPAIKVPLSLPRTQTSGAQKTPHSSQDSTFLLWSQCIFANKGSLPTKGDTPPPPKKNLTGAVDISFKDPS
jgi:hypothetical protein